MPSYEATIPLSTSPPSQQVPLRILLVEDVSLNQKVVLRLLECLGYCAEDLGHAGSTLSSSTVLRQILKKYQRVEVALQLQHPRRLHA